MSKIQIAVYSSCHLIASIEDTPAAAWRAAVAYVRAMSHRGRA